VHEPIPRKLAFCSVSCETVGVADETNIKDFVQEWLTRLDVKLDRVLEGNGEIEGRLALIETRMTALDRSVVHVHEKMVGMQKQLDNIVGRLDRIGKRAELVDAPTPTTS
jgi:uncharacterized coiled-coil protein SlyX